jgi:hypothetical protein
VLARFQYHERLIKISVLWDITPCSSSEIQSAFGRNISSPSSAIKCNASWKRAWCRQQAYPSFWVNWYIIYKRGSVDGWDVILQSWTSLVRFQLRSLCFLQFIYSFYPHYAPELTQPLTEMSIWKRKEKFWWVEHGRHLRLKISPLSLSRLSRQYGILNISQPVTRILFLRREIF